MSGAIATMKGDVDLGELFLVEAKLTRSGQLIIKHDWLEQVQKQSKDIGRAGFYVLHSWIANGSEHYNKIVCIDEGLWYAIVKHFKEKDEK